MPSLGGPEIIVILLVALIFLGPSRLPEVGRQIGGALRELRKVQSDVRAHIDDVLRTDEPTVASSTPAIEPMDAASASEIGVVGGDPAAPPKPASSAPPPPTDSFD